MVLPQELQDIIFLYLDFSTLENCIELQNEFVQYKTQYSTFNDAVKNLKWLKDQGNTHNLCTYDFSLRNGDRDIFNWLKDQCYFSDNIASLMFKLKYTN